MILGFGLVWYLAIDIINYTHFYIYSDALLSIQASSALDTAKIKTSRYFKIIIFIVPFRI